MLFRMSKKVVSQKEEVELAQEIGPAVTVIAPGTRFKGTITGEDTLRISGSVQGDIDCRRMVWVDRSGCVNGNITARRVIIEGEFNGDIASAERVEIRSNGRMTGNITAANIIVDQGCFFDGEARIIR
jgi:cytoskeletal protein CcmA (bactofilin family)